MNTQKVFSQVVKAKSKGKDISIVTDYKNAKDLLKLILCLPNTHIVNIEIANELWKNYYDPYLIDVSVDGGVYCQPAIYENNNIAKGEGLFLIDVLGIGEYLPTDFVIESEKTKIKLIGGD